MIHPADFARMTRDERMVAAYRGDIDSGIHWKVQRVAELTGLDPADLHHELEVLRGWEPHDPDYLHIAVLTAAGLIYEYTGIWPGRPRC